MNKLNICLVTGSLLLAAQTANSNPFSAGWAAARALKMAAEAGKARKKAEIMATAKKAVGASTSGLMLSGAVAHGAIGVVVTLRNGMVVLSVMGTVGFTSFVLEEAEQTCMFGNFGLSKKKSLAKMSIRHLSNCFKLHDTAEAFNNSFGYIYPFGFAYRNYQRANEYNLCSGIYVAAKKLDKSLKDAGQIGRRCQVIFATKRVNKNVEIDLGLSETSKRLGTLLE